VFSTGHFENSGFSLLDMKYPAVTGVGRVDNSWIRNLAISFRDSNTNSWRLSFNPDVCDSDWVNVTRTSPTTWDFVPAGDETACLERGKNGRSGPPIPQGTYVVPFKFTVTRLP